MENNKPKKNVQYGNESSLANAELWCGYGHRFLVMRDA
jgi:hypothetical protein